MFPLVVQLQGLLERDLGEVERVAAVLVLYRHFLPARPLFRLHRIYGGVVVLARTQMVQS